MEEKFKMTVFQIALLIVLLYLCVYSIVNRICKCKETVTMTNAFSESKAYVNNDNPKEENDGTKRRPKC